MMMALPRYRRVRLWGTEFRSAHCSRLMHPQDLVLP